MIDKVEWNYQLFEFSRMSVEMTIVNAHISRFAHLREKGRRSNTGYEKIINTNWRIKKTLQLEKQDSQILIS